MYPCTCMLVSVYYVILQMSSNTHLYLFTTVNVSHCSYSLLVGPRGNVRVVSLMVNGDIYKDNRRKYSGTHTMSNRRTNGWTDGQSLRMITFNKSCNVLKVNPSGKNNIRCQTYAKTEDYIKLTILGIPSTDSRHNGKCNICAFHEEIHAFKNWIFVRLSSLVLASEWTTNPNKFII